MKLKVVCVSIVVCLSMMFFAREGSAQEVQPLEPDWLRQMYEEGWHKVQEGVLSRDAEEGRVETFGYGAEGYLWLIESYRQKLTYFEGKYREEPTDELASLIDGLTDEINRLQGEALAAPAAESFDGEQIDEGCSFDYDATAYAGPLTSAQGVTAWASAYFHTNCAITGNIYAYAYAHATQGTVATTKFQEDPKNNGTWIDSYASASANGSLECESRAQASVEITALNIFYVTPEEINNSCPDTVSISGPTQVTTDYYGSACADVIWTANTTSGRTDYIYEWYLDGILQSETGTTLPRRYCNESRDVTVQVVASDNAGGSVTSPPFTTSIRHIEPIVVSINGPTTANTDYYSSPCVTLTWTAASATGGHPGYTHKWYIGTDPTVQGTGSSFTKQFCPTTSLSTTVKVVVTDSDGHTASATLPLNIQHIGQLAASVSGPATATADYYGPTCVNVTWTATPTGGHPGYTYNWYLGTGTTSQGTGSTFTKNYCPTANQTISVKVATTDSDGHSATSATFTTNLNYRGAIVAKITGPATVSTNTSTPCADVTWTASASSTGHSGYTYRWYLGTSTTLQGSGSTFTKRYCSTTVTVTVKLVATASDNHTDDVTFTSKITHTNSLTASISGPAYVELYGTTCQSVTWTSNASGGTPAYSYSWTIGTSTTVLSTTSTLTKTVCTGGTINVKLTVRDSASQTANAAFTTDVIKECFAECP